MKKITFDSNFGNFDYQATITLPDETLSDPAIRMSRKGIANDMYRAAGSAVEKEFAEEFPMVKCRDKTVDAADRGRRAIPFNNATRAKFEKLANAKCVELAKEDGEPLITVVVTGQHEFGAADDKPTKEATALWTAIQQLPEEQFNDKLRLLGLDPVTYQTLKPEDADAIAIIAVRDALRAARQKAADAAKAALGL